MLDGGNQVERDLGGWVSGAVESLFWEGFLASAGSWGALEFSEWMSGDVG